MCMKVEEIDENNNTFTEKEGWKISLGIGIIFSPSMEICQIEIDTFHHNSTEFLGNVNLFTS